jgi:hypothetical protein
MVPPPLFTRRISALGAELLWCGIIKLAVRCDKRKVDPLVSAFMPLGGMKAKTMREASRGFHDVLP